MDSYKWLLCPVCNSKTRIKLRLDTELKNFPLFCPKCRQETLITVEKFEILVITEPDAQTQRKKKKKKNVVIGSFYLKDVVAKIVTM